MKKSVIVLILAAVLIIIVSPGIVGKLAEQSVDENLNWAAAETGELVVTSEAYDRGWFSSEGRHRVALGDGQLRAAMAAANGDEDALPALIIDTRIDHGLIPVSSMSRDEGSLAPGLGNAVSTLTVEYGDGETLALPGTIYSKVSLGGALDSRYVLEAGTQSVDDGVVSWEPTEIAVTSDAKSGDIAFNGNVGTLTFGGGEQQVTIDGLTFSGEQENTEYGFHVGTVQANMGAMSTTMGGQPIAGMKGMSLSAESSVDNGLTAADMRLEMNGQTIPGFGDVSVVMDIAFDSIDAAALGAVSRQLENPANTGDPGQMFASAENEFKDLVAGGFNIAFKQLDVALPMGTVETAMSFSLPESDRASFEWTSMLLNLAASADIKVPEALVQLATSMNPQAGAIVSMGYLKKNGDVYEMDADFEKGLLTVNGAPIPLPLGMFE